MADERPQLPDFYAVLGVGFDATEAELRAAWRTAVKKWHPDRNPSPEAHSMMARINEAWEVLGNPERRAEYDTVYFTLRAALANAERKRQEEGRLERERTERLRRQEQERKRRQEEAARKRAIEEEERRERARRERERREAEARRKAELERRWREQQRIEEDRREKERQERARRERQKKEAEAQWKAEQEQARREQERKENERKEREAKNARARERLKKRERWRRRDEKRRRNIGKQNRRSVDTGSRSGRVRWRMRRPSTVLKVPFWLGFAVGITLSGMLAVIMVVVITVLVQQSDDAGDQDGVLLVETAGQGTIWSDRNGSVDCSARDGAVRNIAALGEFPRAEALFLTPDVRNWSAGFLYHVSGTGHSAATVRRYGDHYEVVNWTRAGSADVASRRAMFRSDLLNSSDSKDPNSLRIEMSDIGLFLFVNNVALAHVPRHDLRPHPSSVHFCAGFFNNEPTYTVQFVGLRGTIDQSGTSSVPTPRVIRVTATPATAPRIVYVTATSKPTIRIVHVTATPTSVPRIVYVTATPTPTPRIVYVTATPRPTPLPTPVPPPTATPMPSLSPTAVPLPTATTAPMPELVFRGSGSLFSESSDGFIGCPRTSRLGEPAFIGSYAIYGRVEFSFEVPDASNWSIGLLYHNERGNETDASTYIYKQRDGANIRVEHRTRVQGMVVSSWGPLPVASGAFDSTVGSLNSFAIRTDQDGTLLELNGKSAFKVPASVLRPLAGTMQVCAGFLAGEAEDYSVNYAGLRAWTAVPVTTPTVLPTPTPPPSATTKLESTATPLPTVTPVPTATPTSTSTPSPTPTVKRVIETSDIATNALWSALNRDQSSRPTYDEVVRLIGLGADVSALDSSGQTMFKHAVSQGYANSILQLLSVGLSEEAATQSLWAALYKGDRPNRDEVVYLISLGADVSVPDSNGRTMLEYAVSEDYDREIVDLLAATMLIPNLLTSATPTPQQQPDQPPIGSGTLYAYASDGLIGCLARTNHPAFIASDATFGGIEFSFEVPFASAWSIGMLYHDVGADTDAATYVHRWGAEGFRVGHRTRVEGKTVYTASLSDLPAPFEDAVGATNTVSIRTDRDGTELAFNGSSVLRVPISELRPRAGKMQVCVGLLADEPQDYTIDYVVKRAWSE